jgi:hypothetical protein
MTMMMMMMMIKVLIVMMMTMMMMMMMIKVLIVMMMMMVVVLIVGLELWICQKIITLHRGLLRFSSEGCGKGHTFIVELPLFAQVIYIKL